MTRVIHIRNVYIVVVYGRNTNRLTDRIFAFRLHCSVLEIQFQKIGSRR